MTRPELTCGGRGNAPRGALKCRIRDARSAGLDSRDDTKILALSAAVWMKLNGVSNAWLAICNLLLIQLDTDLP